MTDIGSFGTPANRRERVLKAIAHEETDFIPYNFHSIPMVYHKIRDYYGLKDSEEVAEFIGNHVVKIQYLRQFHNDVKISNLAEGNSRKLTVLEVLIPILGRFRPHCGVNFITSLAQRMAFNFGEGIGSKSAYHGWVYGYGLHMTCNEQAFPAMVQVETASISESEVLAKKEATLLQRIQPETLAADNAYTQALRIRRWAKQGVMLLTPALKWVKGRFAQAYHRFLRPPDNAEHLKLRKTSVEPLFDLIAKVIGVNGKRKQLPVQGLDNVRTCLTLATLSVQVAMLANSIWGLPHRNISTMASAFQ